MFLYAKSAKNQKHHFHLICEINKKNLRNLRFGFRKIQSMIIDINCDLGESYGNFKIGNDDAIFPHITSCNIACGFHGGDPLHIETTIKKALAHGLRIGAHPSYPDLAGFGRRHMQLSPEELYALVKYQVAALKGMTESLGGQLAYVKPHGALYNKAASSISVTKTIINAIQSIDDQLLLMGLAGSITEQIASMQNIPFIAEAFADRQYTEEGKLQSRKEVGAVIQDPFKSAEQVVSIVKDNQVISNKGNFIPVKAQSICIHGDNPSAVGILLQIDELFAQQGITKGMDNG